MSHLIFCKLPLTNQGTCHDDTFTRADFCTSPKVIFLFFFLFIFGAAFSQTLPGTVSDADKKPMSNVTVQVKGTPRIVLTDDAGKFSVNASGNDVLIFTSVGFVGQGSSIEW